VEYAVKQFVVKVLLAAVQALLIILLATAGVILLAAVGVVHLVLTLKMIAVTLQVLYKLKILQIYWKK
jgi:hypothetical protein